MSPALPDRARRLNVWTLGIVYFCAYIPYAMLTKTSTSGLISPALPAVPGLALLPLSAVGSLLVVTAFAFGSGWWRDATQVRVAGLSLPRPRLVTALSAVCEAVIIGTTTLAYSFSGLSIVFMMVLMRGGVLVIAPLTDALHQRRIHAYSVIGVLLSLAGVSVALLDVTASHLTWPAALNIAAYLLGYVGRLNLMTRYAKVGGEHVRRAYIVEEQLLALPLLVVGVALAAWLVPGEAGEQLRQGFTGLSAPLAVVALLVGVFYAAAGPTGSLIYLDTNENSYAVPINRGSSIVAGMVSTALIATLTHTPGPGWAQILGAVILFVAMAVLAIGPAREVHALILFVCGDNTGRSAFAEHICGALLTRLGHADRVRVESLGLTARPGQPMHPVMQRVLSERDLDGSDFASRLVDRRLLDRATVVVCMAGSQREAVLAQVPALRGRVIALDPQSDIPSIHGKEEGAVREVAARIERLIEARVHEIIGLAREGTAQATR